MYFPLQIIYAYSLFDLLAEDVKSFNTHYFFCFWFNRVWWTSPPLYILFLILKPNKNLIFAFSNLFSSKIKMLTFCITKRTEPFIQPFVLRVLNLLCPLHFLFIIQFLSYFMEFHCPDLDNQNGWQLLEFLEIRFYSLLHFHFTSYMEPYTPHPSISDKQPRLLLHLHY